MADHESHGPAQPFERDEPWLIYDARESLGKRAGLHALIVGVSDYTHLPLVPDEARPATLGLTKLNSTSLSACRILRWLLQPKGTLRVPLSTCRMMLSAGVPEHHRIRQEGLLHDDGHVSPTGTAHLLVNDSAAVPRATLDNFLAAAEGWRKDAMDADAMTFFYFAGHGSHRSGNQAVLLLDGFGHGVGSILHHSVGTDSLHDGMAPSNVQPTVASMQLYFVDACRNLSDVLGRFTNEEPSRAYSVGSRPGPDVRTAPMYFATAPGTHAYADPKDGSFFSQALIQCLDNDAADHVEVSGRSVWQVDVPTLGRRLPVVVKDLAKQVGTWQPVVKGGIQGDPGDSAIVTLPGAPDVTVTLEVFPRNAVAVTQPRVTSRATNAAVHLDRPLSPHPHTAQWKGGFYDYAAEIVPPTTPFVGHPAKPTLLLPPHASIELRVEP